MDMYVPEEPADNDLKQLFEQHDVNNDGHMDVEEILHILAKDLFYDSTFLQDRTLLVNCPDHVCEADRRTSFLME